MGTGIKIQMGQMLGTGIKIHMRKILVFFHFNPVPIICINLWKKNQIIKIEASQL